MIAGILFSAWISTAEADQYIAGAIILAGAPCTAMVFVWSYLTDGDPAYTLFACLGRALFLYGFFHVGYHLVDRFL
jgi:ACR3 family arsenite transporter